MADGMGGRREGAGRKPGIPNKRSRELADRLAAAGKDPLELLASIVAGEGTPSPDLGLRAQAATALAPYLHPKLSPRPVPLYVETPLGLAPPTTAAEAAQQIAIIATKAANGELDLDQSKTLIANLQAFTTAIASGELEDEVAALRDEIARDVDRAGG